MRLEAIALASSANSLRHRQLERRRRERRDAAARARLLRFRASCADDMCCGLVVMVGAMVLAAGGRGAAGGPLDLGALVRECRAGHGGAWPVEPPGALLAPAWRPSLALDSLLSAAEDALRAGACVANGLMRAVGAFSVMLLLAVFVYRSTSTRTPAGADALPTAMPISSLLLFNGLICGTAGKLVVGPVMGGNADAWFAAWLALMAAHACTLWMGAEVCAAIDGDAADGDEDGEDKPAAGGVGGRPPGGVPTVPMALLFHASLAVVLPALVGVLPWCDPRAVARRVGLVV